MNSRIDHIRREQAEQRGFIRQFAGYYLACALFGYFIAYMLHALADRSAQW